MTSLLHSVLPRSFLLIGALLLGPAVTAENAPSIVDDFSRADLTSIGSPRIVVNDASLGGKSHLDHAIADGVIKATGKIAPARGQPGFVSLVLPLAEPGGAMDLSPYDGIRLRVRISSGSLSVSANSNQVDNFDYHSAVVTRSADGDFHEVRIPWSKMKRAWSEQTALDPATINSISLVAANLQPGAFAYDIDEIGFY